MLFINVLPNVGTEVVATKVVNPCAVVAVFRLFPNVGVVILPLVPNAEVVVAVLVPKIDGIVEGIPPKMFPDAVIPALLVVVPKELPPKLGTAELTTGAVVVLPKMEDGVVELNRFDPADFNSPADVPVLRNEKGFVAPGLEDVSFEEVVTCTLELSNNFPIVWEGVVDGLKENPPALPSPKLNGVEDALLKVAKEVTAGLLLNVAEDVTAEVLLVVVKGVEVFPNLNAPELPSVNEDVVVGSALPNLNVGVAAAGEIENVAVVVAVLLLIPAGDVLN